VDFAEFEDVTDAFSQLLCMLQQGISDLEFPRVKTSCLVRADKPLKKLIRASQNLQQLFEILAENHTYCNWMEVRLLKAVATGHPKLLGLIKEYKKVIYSKPLRDIWNDIPVCKVRNKYYTELKAEFEDDPDNMTVEQLLMRKEEIANKIGVLIMEVQSGSLIIKFLVQTNKVYQAYLLFLTIPQQLRSDRFLQIGAWIVYFPQFVLQELQKIYRELRNICIQFDYTYMW